MKGILDETGCQNAWLASNPAAEGFWKACGFRETGEYERDQKIFTLYAAATKE